MEDSLRSAMQRAGDDIRRHRNRRYLGIGFAVALATSMLVAARASGEFAQSVLIELGAGLLLLVGASVLLANALAEFRTDMTRDHRHLDRDALIEHIRGSRREIGILETWTGLLEPAFGSRCLEALKTALQRGAQVRILLLDPDGKPTAQRTDELGGRPDVQEAIIDNLRLLRDFYDGLDEELRQRLQIRIYFTMPAVQLYRWDDKAMVSFFSPQKPTYEVSQLETFVSTSLADFVTQRFEALWDGTTMDLDEYMHSTARLRCADEPESHCQIEYIHADGDAYVGGRELEQRLVPFALSTVSLSWSNSNRGKHSKAGDFRLEAVASDADHDAHLTKVHNLYRVKYGDFPRLIFRLVRDDSVT
ncbi:MAG: hypothetical protein ACRDXX_08435 [Stackebrandtia sp.]